MVGVRRASEALDLDLGLRSRDIVQLLGMQSRRLAAWHEKTWTGRSGPLQDVSFTPRNLVAIAAMHHWVTVGVPLDGRLAGRLYYAVRAAKFPFVLVHMTGGDSWVQAVEPENLGPVLSGAPPAVVYDPESLLEAVYLARDKFRR